MFTSVQDFLQPVTNSIYRYQNQKKKEFQNKITCHQDVDYNEHNIYGRRWFYFRPSLE